MSCLISIIIPCFNSGRFLQKTIDMIENEDIGDCEIVLIDDGSDDDTLSIIEENSRRYGNIRYISRENRGVAASRNEGLLAAQGHYVYFLDSDDEITKGTLLHYKNRINKFFGFDLIAFGYKMIRNNGNEHLYVNHKLNGLVLKNQEFADLIFRSLLFMHICSVLFHRDFLIRNKFFFKEGIRIGEDFDFLQDVSLCSKRVYYDERICFIYKLRRGSATDGHHRYNSDFYKALLLCFRKADSAKGILEEQTINCFLATRYSAHLRLYLQSRYKSKELNGFFLQNRSCLYKKMHRSRPIIMLVIYFFRVLPIGFILKTLKSTSPQ